MTSPAPATERPSGLTQPRRRRRTGEVDASSRNRLVLLLAVTSGATDAIGFLALGSAFTSVMTGNLVLFGMGLAHGDFEVVRLTAIAIAAFVIGAAVGARVAGNPQGTDPAWPPAVTRALWIEFALFVVIAGAWWGFGSQPPQGSFMALLALSAAALGLQSSAIQRFGVAGLSTTYLTGTLTSIVIKLSSGQGLRAVSHPLLILGGLIVGAALAAGLLASAPTLVPLTQLLTLGAVLLRLALGRQRPTAGSPQ